jgi:carbon storage regulator
MLVISRKKNESVVINNNVTVTVVEIRDDKVRLGVLSPKEVPVHRQEVYEAIHSHPQSEIDPDYVEPAPLTQPMLPPDDSWRPHLDKADPAGAESNERRAGYLGRLASDLRQKSGKDLSLGNVADTIIDAVYYSGIDLGQADSLENLKKLLVRNIRRSDV